MFHLDIFYGEFPPEMTIPIRRRRLEIFFFNFSNRFQAYERNRTVRFHFCLRISVVL